MFSWWKIVNHDLCMYMKLLVQFSHYNPLSFNEKHSTIFPFPLIIIKNIGLNIVSLCWVMIRIYTLTSWRIKGSFGLQLQEYEKEIKFWRHKLEFSPVALLKIPSQTISPQKTGGNERKSTGGPDLPLLFFLRYHSIPSTLVPALIQVIVSTNQRNVNLYIRDLHLLANTGASNKLFV